MRWIQVAGLIAVEGGNEHDYIEHGRYRQAGA